MCFEQIAPPKKEVESRGTSFVLEEIFDFPFLLGVQNR